MEREYALSLIQKKEWSDLLNKLKDNEVFNRLAQDHIFLQVFNKYFIEEIITHDSNHDSRITELTAIHIFHNSKNHKFQLTKENYEKLLMILIETTKSLSYALELPEHEISKEIVLKHQKEQEEEIKTTRIKYEIESNFMMSSSSYISSDSYVIPIFKSPQEEEFYFAAKEFFEDVLLLPNAALSTVINNKVLDKLEGNNISFFLSTTIDLVIVDINTKMPIYFFELDSKFHDAPEQKKKDKLKNELIEEAGFKLHRIRKKKSSADTENYITMLNKIIQGNAK